MTDTSDESDLKNLVKSFTQSHIIIGRRVERSSENPYGFKHVDAIPADEVALLFLGGTGTEVKKGGDRSANGYLSTLEGYLKGHGLEEVLQQQGKDPDLKKGIGLYSIIYDFGMDISGGNVCRRDLAREKLYADHKQFISDNKNRIKEDLINLNEETVNPHYIDELFEKTFLLRICDEKGKKLPLDEACRRIRNLTVCAHCHGAYTFLKMEEKLRQKMKQVGFSDEEQAKIQSQLLCVTLAPDAPLGISKSRMISFASAFDTKIRMNGYGNYNNFKRVIHCIFKSKNDGGIKTVGIRPSYLPEKRGEIFLVEKIYNESEIFGYANDAEHNFLNNKDSDSLTKGGKLLFSLAANAILNGIQSSLMKTPLPSTEELICGQDEANKAAFQKLRKNGEDLWNMVKKVLREILLYERNQNKR